MFEVFDHTADLGLRIRAADVDSLFAEAGRAFLSVVVSNPDTVEARDALTIEVACANREDLLVDWLNELLFLLETRKFLASKFETAVTADGLRATLRGEPYDSARHVLSHEVKAVTYHALKIEETKDGWLAEVILDI